MPSDLTPVPLPSHAPELNPVERAWLFLRERFLPHRLLDGFDAIVAAYCQAWSALRERGSFCNASVIRCESRQP